MQLHQPTPEQGVFGLRAMYTVATVDGRMVDAERALLSAARDFTGAATTLDELTPITPEALTEAIEGDALRWQLLCALVLASMVDGRATPDEVAQVEAYSAAFGVDNSAVGTLRKMSRGQLTLARFDIVRRFWGRDKLLEQVKEDGLVNTIQALRRRRVNPDKAARYRALGELAEGTLGRSYFEFITRHGFSFPGEPGHGPDLIALHDMAHVLGGYEADLPDEILVGFFSAGFRRQEPMTFVLLTMMQLQLGIPTMPGQPVATGMLRPAHAVEALSRGAAMNTDLSDGWDPWPVVDAPLDELRERYGVPPRTMF